MENPFKKPVTEEVKGEEKKLDKTLTILPDGTVSEDIKPEQYQEIQKDK